MREFVKGFKDRKGSNITKKRIEVLEREDHANGQMTLKGTINRADTGVTEEGTRLDAESMNNAVLDLVNYELFGVDYNYFETNFIEIFLDIVRIYYNGPRLYANVEQNDYLNFVIDNAVDKSEIEITGGAKLSDLEYETPIDFYINLYLDKDCTYFVTRVKKRINYVPSSTSSND